MPKKDETPIDRFMEEVFNLDENLPSTLALITIKRVDAVAVALHLLRLKEARQKGGANSKGKGGRKIENDTPEAKAKRQYMREYRQKNK